MEQANAVGDVGLLCCSISHRSVHVFRTRIAEAMGRTGADCRDGGDARDRLPVVWELRWGLPHGPLWCEVGTVWVSQRHAIDITAVILRRGQPADLGCSIAMQPVTSWSPL